MPRLLPNRSSRILTQTELSAIFTASDTIDAQLGAETPITKEEYDALAKLGDKLKTECDAVFDVIREQPKYLDEEQSVAEIEKDKTACEQYDSVIARLQKLLDKAIRERGIRGAEYRNACSAYEENVVGAAKKGRLDAQMVKDRLGKIPRNRVGGKSTKSKGKGDKTGGQAPV